MALVNAVSTKNSSTTPLAGAATYTGTWESCLDVSSISVAAFTNANGALYVDFSTDATNVDRTETLSHASDSDLGVHTLTPLARWFRVRLVNGSSAQGYLRLQTILNNEPRIALPGVRPYDTLSLHSSALLTRPSITVECLAALGKIDGVLTVHKFGSNPDVSTGFEDLWSVGGSYNWITSPDRVQVKAGGDANDTAAGTGARTILVHGLDDAYNLVSETLTLAGASASAATVALFSRVFRAYVVDVGTYTGNNAGNIDIETTSATLLARIPAGDGQTEMAIFSVPVGYTALITGVTVSCSDPSKTFDFRLLTRPKLDATSAPFGGVRMLSSGTQIRGGGIYETHFDCHAVVPEKSDVWLSVKASAATTPINGTIEYVLVRD